MTRKEAIEIFKRLKENAPNEMHIETVGSAQELFDMAIQALSQEPCDDAEQIDYHDDFETASRKIHDYEERQKQNDKKCGSYNNTNTFKSCCDCKLIGTDSCYMSCGGSKSLYKPKQKSEPCTDAVSRQAVLDYLKVNVDDFPDYHEAIEKVLQMPSVTQKPNMTWVTGADGAKIAFKDVPVWKAIKICEILGAPQESEDKEMPWYLSIFNTELLKQKGHWITDDVWRDIAYNTEFLEFLYNHINPNDMEHYRQMFEMKDAVVVNGAEKESSDAENNK